MRSIQKKFLLLFAFAKSRVLFPLPTSINQRFHNLRRIQRKIPRFRRISHANRRIRSRKVRNCRIRPRFYKTTESKIFCYFWLLPKVESFLPCQLQLTKRGRGVESTLDSTLDSTIPQNPPSQSAKS